MVQMLTLEEAMVWTERTLASAGVAQTSLWQIPIMKLLDRHGERVTVDDPIGIAALLTCLMTLLHGDRCSAAVVTATPDLTENLFTAPILGSAELTGLRLGLMCNKHFLNVSGIAASAPELEMALYDPSKVPVAPLEAFRRLYSSVPLGGPPTIWQRLSGRQAEPSRLLKGFWMLNAVVHAGHGWVSMSSDTGSEALMPMRMPV
jgi:hypothetical protein